MDDGRLLVNTQLNTMYMTTMTTSFLAIGIVVYSLGRYTRGRRTLVGGAAVYLASWPSTCSWRPPRTTRSTGR